MGTQVGQDNGKRFLICVRFLTVKFISFSAGSIVSLKIMDILDYFLKIIF